MYAPACPDCNGSGISSYTGHKTWCGSCSGTGIEGVKTDKLTKGRLASPIFFAIGKHEYYEEAPQNIKEDEQPENNKQSKPYSALCDCEQLFIGCAVTGSNCITRGLKKCE
jgi:hypothetical protein